MATESESTEPQNPKHQLLWKIVWITAIVIGVFGVVVTVIGCVLWATMPIW